MVDNTVPVEQKHPEEYQQDMNKEPFSGNNWGQEGPHPEKDAENIALHIKEIHNRYPELTNDELRQIVVIPAGHRLEQNATYLDLKADKPEEFTATADMVAGDNNWYVPKSETDYQLWNRLIGVDNPERTGQANDA